MPGDWGAIQYVTGGATLLAFLAYAILIGHRSSLNHKLALIAASDKPGKQRLAAGLSGELGIDIRDIPEAERTGVVKAELQRRHERAQSREGTLRSVGFGFLIAFVVVVVFPPFPDADDFAGSHPPVVMEVYDARDYISRPGAPKTNAQQQLNNEIKGMLPRQLEGEHNERQRVLVLTLSDHKGFRDAHGPFSLGLPVDEIEKVADAKGGLLVLDKPTEQFTAKLLRADGQIDPIDAARAETQTGRKYLRFDIPGVEVGDDLLVMIRRHAHAEPFFPDDQTITLRDVRDLE